MSGTQAHVQIELGPPVTAATAPPEIQAWGPYQFPGILRLPDGNIQVSFHVEADSATSYGLPPARAISTDNGKTWALQPREVVGSGTVSSNPPPLYLPNGDWLSVKVLRPQPIVDLKLPPQPVGAARYYGDRYPWYRVEDLAPECGAGWMLYRRAAGQVQ